MDQTRKKLWRAHLDAIPSCDDSNRVGLAGFVLHIILLNENGMPAAALQDRRTSAGSTWGHHLTTEWLDLWLQVYRELSPNDRQELVIWLMDGAPVEPE